MAALLQAAACVIGDVGYESATMAAIAERADASIGSLYQFFPNKESVVEALRAQYVKEIEKLWAALAAEASNLQVADLVSRLFHSQIEFAEGHPAFLALFDAPPTVNTLQRREIIRGRIVEVILKRKPRMSRSKAFRLAAVVHQIVKGLLTLYARSDKSERFAIVDEFKVVLTGYLSNRNL
ncbi:MAG TPA: TetR/AcrR family transcriptional regulator [Terriglobia bacterium]|nr:TetR/AcrR family transcriptional regulator [Terriglobia bacterium]